MVKQITFFLNPQSLNNAAKTLEDVRDRINNTEREFIRLSIEWLRARASENIALNYPDFAEDFETIITSNLGILKTTDEQQTYIEFGTGIVGSGDSHELAEEKGWQYDVNKHGEKGWTFLHGADDKLDVKESNIISRKVADHTGMWERIRTKGVEAERFMFNAFTDYFNKGVYKQIFKTALISTQKE